MRGTTHILLADGDEVHNVHYSPLELEWMQSKVGGPIQEIPGFTSYMRHPCVAYCDEEGKMKDKPVNKEATMAWRMSSYTPDILVGDVLIVSGDDEFMEAL